MSPKSIILSKKKEKIEKNENSSLNYLGFDSFFFNLNLFLLIIIRFEVNFIDFDSFFDDFDHIFIYYLKVNKKWVKMILKSIMMSKFKEKIR